MTNTTNTLSFIGIIALLSACSSATTVDGKPEGDAGAGVIDDGGAAGVATGGTGNTVVPGSGGVVSETGGTNTGGTVEETGGANNTGGVEETGGTETGGVGGAYTGGANTGGTDICIPKTCLTIAIELSEGQTDPVPEACGIVSDGCGNYIDCGGCDNGYCGGGSLGQTVDGWELDDGIAGLCGGGCEIVIFGPDVVMCSDGRNAIQCSRDTNDVPSQRISGRQLTNCTKTTNYGEWCCSQVY